MLGDTDTSKIPWYNDSGRETQAVKEKIYALLKVVSESGVNVSKQKNLSGALGVSNGGSIDVLEDADRTGILVSLVFADLFDQCQQGKHIDDRQDGNACLIDGDIHLRQKQSDQSDRQIAYAKQNGADHIERLALDVIAQLRAGDADQDPADKIRHNIDHVLIDRDVYIDQSEQKADGNQSDPFFDVHSVMLPFLT